MSDLHQSESERADLKVGLIFVVTVQAAGLSCLMIGFVLSSYFGHLTLPQLVSFPAADTPPVPGSVFPGPLGVHSFGDFLQPFWQSRLSPSPYLSGYSSYPPFANGIFWFVAHLPFWVSLVMVQTLSVLILGLSLGVALPHSMSQVRRFRTVVLLLLLSAPIINALDRGNIQILTISSMLLASASYLKEKWKLAALLLGAAAAIKGYPILLAVIFLRRGQVRHAVTAIATAACLTIIPLLCFGGGFLKNVSALRANLENSQSELSHLYAAYNNSAGSLLRALDRIGIASNLEATFQSTVRAVVLLALVAVCFLSWNSGANLYRSMAATAFMVLNLDFAPAYALGVLFATIFWLFAESARDKLDYVLRCIIAVVLGLVLVPKQFPLHPHSMFAADGTTLSNLVNPTLLLIALLTSLVGAYNECFLFRRRRGKD